MGTEKFVEKCKKIIVDYFNRCAEKTDKTLIAADDVYVVWCCKTLQNNKALLSTTVTDGMYYEITYNGDKDEFYLDAYKKSVCPFCMDERKADMDLEDMIGMLERLPDAIKFVDIVVEDEMIGLIIPSEKLLSLLKEDDEFLNYYIFSGPIKNIDIEGGVMHVDL